MDNLLAAFRLTVFLIFTIPLMPVQQLLLWVWPPMARRLPLFYHRLVCMILGFRIKTCGPRPTAGPALLVSNHVSWIDIVILSAVLPCSFIAKREVARWPFFGTLARLQRSVFVDRERRRSTGKSRDEIGARLNAGEKVVLFPEGTSGDGNSVRPFRSTFFGAADDSAIPVIPVTVAYAMIRNLPMTRRDRPFFAWYGDMELAPHLWAAVKAGPITVEVIFHEALRPDTRKSRKDIATAAETTIRRSLAEALHPSPKSDYQCRQ